MVIHELCCGAARLRLAPELGGRVTALSLDAGNGMRTVLHPFPEVPADLLRWPKGGIYPLAPYSNRVREARVAGRRLLPHPDAAPHALHGPAHRAVWRTDMVAPDQARLSLRREPDAEWPWRIEVTQSFRLTAPDRAEIAIALRNGDSLPMPAGIGLHPYFRHDPSCAVEASAPIDWPVQPDGFAGSAKVGTPPLAGPLPTGDITLYRSGWDGRAEATLPGGARIALTVLSGRLDHLVVHRPAAAAYLCIEPVSHVADAFNRPDGDLNGAALLQPGEEMAAVIALTLLR